MSYRDTLRRLAFDRHGIVTTSEATDIGVPPVEVRKLASRGALSRVGHGVYRMTEAPFDDLTPFAEAVALAGPDAVIADDSVLDMHDLGLVNPRRIKVATPHRVRGKLPETIRLLHRPSGSRDVEYVDGVASMPLTEALIRSQGVVMKDRLQDAIDDALGRRLISADEAEVVRSALRGNPDGGATAKDARP